MTDAIDGFLDRLEVFFPRAEGLEILASWNVPFSEMERVEAEGVPTVDISFPLDAPRRLTFWELFYLKVLRHQGEKGMSLLARPAPSHAGIELFLVRKT